MDRHEAGHINPHMHGRVLGLVGFGRIPRLVARRLAGFDLTVLAYDPYVPAAVMMQTDVWPIDFDALLAQADFVSVHTPLTPQTRHLIGEPQLRQMKRSAILLNTSRGPVVDEPALVRALSESWIAGAGLDVFEQEPIDPANPLLKLDNVVVSPHIASSSDEYMNSCYRHTYEAILDLAGGYWPPSYVNHEVKPRMALRER